MYFQPVVNNGIFTKKKTGAFTGFLNHPTVGPRRKFPSKAPRFGWTQLSYFTWCGCVGATEWQLFGGLVFASKLFATWPTRGGHLFTSGDAGNEWKSSTVESQSVQHKKTNQRGVRRCQDCFLKTSGFFNIGRSEAGTTRIWPQDMSISYNFLHPWYQWLNAQGKKLMSSTCRCWT